MTHESDRRAYAGMMSIFSHLVTPTLPSSLRDGFINAFVSHLTMHQNGKVSTILNAQYFLPESNESVLLGLRSGDATWLLRAWSK